MLEELHLENFVLFEDVQIRWGPGLNVVSGETGSGKSLLADALAFALGARAENEMIRTGAEETVATAIFSLSSREELSTLLEEGGIKLEEDGQLLFQRILRRGRPSRLLLNGRPVALGTARILAERLLDLSAQNEQTRLMDPLYQNELLDRFGGIDRTEFTSVLNQAKELNARLHADRKEQERIVSRLEEIQSQLEAIAAIHYTPEDDRLEERIREMSHAEAIQRLAGEAIAMLYEDETAIQDRLSELLRASRELGAHSSLLQHASESLADALASIRSAVEWYRKAMDSTELMPGELEAAIERSESLRRLARRLGIPISAIPQKEAELREEWERLADGSTDPEQAFQKFRALLEEASRLALHLRLERKQVAQRMTEAIQRELSDLGLPDASFLIEFRPLWKEEDPLESLLSSAHTMGIDEIRFLLAPNPGESPSPLSTTASGGETSRAMLAIKSALTEIYAPSVLFFDEIDVGVGGRLGDVVGRKLRALAAARQVIAITHLPQIAAYADRHFKVEKRIQDGRTYAEVIPLEGEARVEEIAAMMRGRERTANTLREAREMLRHGERKEKSSG